MKVLLLTLILALTHAVNPDAWSYDLDIEDYNTDDDMNSREDRLMIERFDNSDESDEDSDEGDDVEEEVREKRKNKKEEEYFYYDGETMSRGNGRGYRHRGRHLGDPLNDWPNRFVHFSTEM